MITKQSVLKLFSCCFLERWIYAWHWIYCTL